MSFWETVTPAEMQVAQTLTMSMVVIWLFVVRIPPLKPYIHQIRVATVVFYLTAVAAFVAPATREQRREQNR